MTKRNKYILIFGCVVLMVYAVSNMIRQENSSVPAVVFDDGTVVLLDLAKTLEEQRKGLSSRPIMQENQGMLFVYSIPEIRTFWMKDMLFPIDIIWLDHDRVVGYEQMVPLDTQLPYTIYTSPEPITRVLEVSSGFVQKHGVHVGDFLDIHL